MAKKKPAIKPATKHVKRGRRVSVEVDKVAMTAAALGTFLIANEVSAAEDDKQNLQAQQDLNLLQAQLEQSLQLDPAALSVPELPADLAELLGGELPAEALSSDFPQISADVPVADLDGMTLSQAAPDTTTMPGVDGKTTMSDAGSAGSASGSGGAAAGSAAETGAAAGGAAGGAAAGGLPGLAAFSPAGLFAGAISVAAAAGASGGGGSVSSGGGSVANTVASVLKGLVVDGNVRGATVFYDKNANGILDSDEKSTTTDANGNYTLTGYDETAIGRIVVYGGVDVLTGQTIGMMITPHGYTNVNPLTTLLAASPGVTEAQLKAKLGIDPSIDLNHYDPLADMADPAKAAAAQKAFTIAQQVYAVLQSAASLQAQTTDGTVDPADITSIANKLLDGIMNSSAGDSTAILQEATKSTVTQAANGNTALQDSVTAALNTVTSQIATDYGNLAQLLQNGDSTAIANAVKVAAVSQTALTNAISSGDTSTLSMLSNADSLNKLADLYKAGIASNISNGGSGSVTVSAPGKYTVAEATTLANGSGLPANYTISDDWQAIKTYLVGHSNGSPLLTGAIGVVVKSATPIPGDAAVSILNAIPLASFQQLNLAIPSNQVASISVQDAVVLAKHYLKFASADHVKIAFNPATELASLVTNAQVLATLGVATLVPSGSFSLTAGQATAIVTTGKFVFDSSNVDITLNVTATELGQALATADGALALHTAGIDYLAATSGNLSLTVAQAQNLLGAQLQLSASQHGAVLTNDTSNISVGTLSSLAAAHIDTIGSSLTDTHHLETSNLFAKQMVIDGLHFASSDDVHLGLTASGATATHLGSSLKDLQKLGVDSIGVTGHVGNVFVDVGAGSWGTGALPTFKAGDTVDLRFDNVQLDDVIAHKADLVGANIDELYTSDANGQVTLNIGQADSLLGGDGQFNSGTDLGFNAGNTVTLTVDNDSNAISHIAGEAQALHEMGVDLIDVAGHGSIATINDAQALALVNAGLAFSTDDTVNLAVASGSHVHTSLQQLQQLGVDNISVAGGGAMTIGLGDISKIDFDHLPKFTDGDHVTLSLSGLTEAQGNMLFEYAAQLHAAHIDTLYVTDSGVQLSLAEADIFSSNGLQFAASNDVTLEVSADPDTHQSANEVLADMIPDSADLQLLGVDHLQAFSPVELNESAARVLVHAGIDFTADSDVTMNVHTDMPGVGTHLSSTLKDLQTLGVDHVIATGAHDLAIDLGPGGWNSTNPLPNFDPDLNVRLNVGASQIGQITNQTAQALHSHGIDSIQVHGTETQLNALSVGSVANVNAFTLDMTEADFANLTSALNHLPQVGAVHVDKIDVTGMAGHTGELHVGADVAQAMIAAGLSFEAADHIAMDVQVGAHGTSFATNANTLHQLGVDDVTVHFDNNQAVDLGLLSHFDDSLNVTLDLSETPNANLPTLDASTGALLRSLGFDSIEVNADINSLTSDLLGFDPAVLDGGALDVVHGLMQMKASVDLQGGADSAHTANLDTALNGLFNALPHASNASFNKASDLINTLKTAGITEMNIERGATSVSDGLLDALADSGMLHALPNSYLAVDATASGYHLFTSLKDLSDLDVDSVTTSSSGNVYINLGDLGQVGALAEVKAILSHLDNDMFHGSGTPTLVLDSRTVSALLDSQGHINSDIMAGLEHIGIKEVAVLVGHNESAVVAQTPLVAGSAPAVTIIGQDMNPDLYDELHHPRQ